MSRERELDAWIDGLLADPQFHGHPLHQALARLRQQSLEQLVRLERIARISDGFQSMAREQNLSLSERYHKQLRRLEKVARISDRYQQMMRDLNLALKEASIRDPLTGLPNRRMLLERLREENERSQRHGQSYVLAMLDVDFFKQVNDTWGHDSGDRVLVEIARAMESELREYDLCGRRGGEEFLLLLPQTRLQDAGPVLERVRDSVRTLAVRVGTEALSVTASVGVTEHRIGETYSQTVNRADAALLDAKRSGRDKCVFAALPPLPAPSRPAPAR
ncbi:TPA: biofilm formation regulator diguanylate cyclase SiaD [Pseudomonas aeruginosa]